MRFVFISSVEESWGGSEELWAGSATSLAEMGHKVSAFKKNVGPSHPRVRKLSSLGCTTRDLNSLFPVPTIPVPFVRTLQGMLVNRVTPVLLRRQLERLRPDLVVVSQGDNFDGFYNAVACKENGFPYVIIVQKASDSYWPADFIRHEMAGAYRTARKCFFVSNHNMKLTENQVGEYLANAEVVHNPFMVSSSGVLPWPQNDGDGLRLACVARLLVQDKGQDVLLHVLAQRKWKERNLHVSFYGQGINQGGLEGMAHMLGVKNISFNGFERDIESIWRTHHALILPSRAEGLPLALVEAMMYGRPAIVTNVGGNAEVVNDGVTGFLAATPTIESIDETLERAWSRRRELKDIGLAAAQSIRKLVPNNPVELFTDKLLKIASNDGSIKNRW